MIKFFVLPNGRVNRVDPLQRTATDIEAATLNYVQEFRFEKLPAEDATERWGTYRMVYKAQKR